MPKMIACEAENLDVMEKTFKPWTYLWTGVPERKGKAHAYCYHIYNFDSNSDMNYVKQRLETLGNEMVGMPNFMTEYDGMSWFKTARTIQYELLYANCSAYLYWNIYWYDRFTAGDGTRTPMITYINDNKDYVVGPFYYLIKHFAKYIDRDYVRVDVIDDNNKGLETSAFVSPDGKKVTIISVNPTDSKINYDINVEGQEILEIEAYQSKDSDKDNCYQKLKWVRPGRAIALEAQSITTISIKLK